MPPPYRIQVRVQGVIQRYSYMQTTRSIKRGEEIIQEKPLTDLPLSLTQLYDETTFMVLGAQRNGLQALQDRYDAMSAPDQIRFMRLHNAHAGIIQAGNDILGRFKTNAFMEEEKMQGHDFQVLMIYDKISKVNHSCRPNAVLSYDPGIKMGSLRALSNIDRDQEIFINYRSSEEFTFSDEVARSRTLQNDYGFHCQCPACSLTGTALTRDRNTRDHARTYFAQIIAPLPNRGDDREAQNTDLLTMLQTVGNYITQLKTLKIADGKLAWAYQQEADLHVKLFHLLEAFQVQRTHCQNYCRGQPNPRYSHIMAAQNALRDRLTYNIGIHGSEHPGIKEDNKYINELAELAIEVL